MVKRAGAAFSSLGAGVVLCHPAVVVRPSSCTPHRQVAGHRLTNPITTIHFLLFLVFFTTITPLMNPGFPVQIPGSTSHLHESPPFADAHSPGVIVSPNEGITKFCRNENFISQNIKQ